MKPSKSKKKRDNLSTQKIPNFFKATPKQFDTKGNNDCDYTKAFYIEELKKRLQKVDVEVEDATTTATTSQEEDGAYAVLVDNELHGDTESNKNHIDQESNVSKSTPECTGCKDWERKYKDLKKVHLKLTYGFSELSLKHNDLLKTKTPTNQLDIDNPVSLIDDVFTPNELKYLQAIPLEKSKDSSFIMKSLEFAYKRNLAVLHHRTLKGKPELVLFGYEGEMEQQARKDPLTPKKVQRINELFVERISKCQNDSVAYGERIKESNVNKLFATGIINIAKKQK